MQNTQSATASNEMQIKYLPPEQATTENLIKRLRACVFIAIDPQLAAWAANTIQLQAEEIKTLKAALELWKTKYARMMETTEIIDTALREYQQKYGE